MIDVQALKTYLKTNWFKNKIEAEEAARIAYDYFGKKYKLNFRWFGAKEAERGYTIITSEDFENFLRQNYENYTH